MMAKFITFEGVDGAGKSSNIQVATSALTRRGIPHIVTREPGGTPAAESIRELLLNPLTKLHPESETLLLFAARKEHLDHVIFPALKQGKWVICDRFTDATYAYQGAGKGVSTKIIDTLAALVHPGLTPDLTFCFDLPPALAQSRIDLTRSRDRFEMEALDFHERVRMAYLRLAAVHPERIRLLDASRPLLEVNRAVEQIIAAT